ncbi:MAG: transposase [Methanobrevibacter sp.]|nr:transposase [Candidatus Methanovirga aequatorialis]
MKDHIGHIKENLNYRQTNLRGKNKVQSEVNLIALAHNLKILHNKNITINNPISQEKISI